MGRARNDTPGTRAVAPEAACREVDGNQSASPVALPREVPLHRAGGLGLEAFMRFARIVFLVAGVWGIVVLTPLFFLIDVTGRQYEPPAMYPQFFYGFLSVAMAWQVAFLLIGSDPARFRPLMLPSVV